MSDQALTSLALRASRAFARYVPTQPRLALSHQPVVSFTFDDVPESAYLQGARLLDEYGLRGTFYIAPGICGTSDAHWRVISRDQVADLSRRGHEIGCHTYAHVPVQSLSTAALADDNRRCCEALRQICGDIPLKSFAFPFGNAGFVSKCLMQVNYQTCRGIRVGINRGLVDLAMLCVRELYDSCQKPVEIDAVLDGMMQRGGWLVFYTHDVADRPSSIGCSPGLLGHAIKAATSRGIACMTVAQAAAELSLVPRSITT